MNRVDRNLIGHIAQEWVDGGGDADGIRWCVNELVKAVQEEIEYRKERDSQEEE